MSGNIARTGLDAHGQHEACSIYPQEDCVSAGYSIQLTPGKITIKMENGVALFFPNKWENLKDKGIEEVPFDLVHFRKTGELRLLVSMDELSEHQQKLYKNIMGEFRETIRLSGGVIDTYLDENGNRFLLATMRDAGSGMGFANQVTTSAGGMYGEDIIGGCAKEMAEESPIIVRAPDGTLKLALPRIPGKEEITYEGLSDGVEEFLSTKIGTFLSNIEGNLDAQKRFLEDFGIPHHELQAFLLNAQRDIKNSLVWLDTTPDDAYNNTEVTMEDGHGERKKHSLWMYDERGITHSIELKIPVLVRLPNGYVFAGKKPKLYLESTRQEPVKIQYVDGWGLQGDVPGVVLMPTLVGVNNTFLIHEIRERTRNKVSEFVEK